MTEFLRRALEEAARYGDDPWLFVRELVQNARDAGATRVNFTAERVGAVERLTCRDDGAGMSVDDARRYLLTLYASSKRGDELAGRFGIGFWTVLRFAPTRILVRSMAKTGGRGWELEVDGALERTRLVLGSPSQGTEVVLERPARGADLVAAVRGAVAEMAPFPTTRHHPEQPLAVSVNGESAGRPFALVPPALYFQRRGLRGVVALGAEPQVELFAYGLKVRSAAYLEDLLTDASGRAEESAAGAVPRALLDSNHLEVLLARGDARDDRALRRLVGVARRELRRLLAAELDRIAPRPWPARVAERLAGWWTGRRRVVAGLALGVAGVVALWQLLPPGPRSGPVAGPAVRPVAAAPAPYRDPLTHYRGPVNDPLPEAVGAVDIRYSPPGALLLGVARFDGLAAASAGLDALPLRLADGPACRAACVDVTLGIAGGTRLRLPVAPGHRVDPASVRLDGEALELMEDSTGGPVVVLPPDARGRLSYRTGPTPGWPVLSSWPALPAQLEAEVAGWHALPTAERVARATALVRRTVHYRVGGPALGGGGFVAAALAAGAGDCDVQNAVLAVVLTGAGVPARLAVGYTGRDGSVAPVLHAWVEYLREGHVAVADASAVTPAAVSAQPPGRRSSTRAADAAPGAALAAAAAVGGLLALIAAAFLGQRRDRRRLELGDSADAAEMLHGVLLRERPWPGAEILLQRPLIPLVGGGWTSLKRARRLAAVGALGASRRGSALVRRAVAGGATVVDAARPAGRVAADGLGLADLDALAPLVVRRVLPPLALEVNRVAAHLKERWRLAVVDGAPASLTVVPALPSGVTGVNGELVLVDEASSLWRAALTRWPERPAAARFLLADAVVHQLRAPGRSRRRVLAEFARAALEEAAGGN